MRILCPQTVLIYFKCVLLDIQKLVFTIVIHFSLDHSTCANHYVKVKILFESFVFKQIRNSCKHFHWFLQQFVLTFRMSYSLDHTTCENFLILNKITSNLLSSARFKQLQIFCIGFSRICFAIYIDFSLDRLNCENPKFKRNGFTRQHIGFSNNSFTHFLLFSRWIIKRMRIFILNSKFFSNLLFYPDL